MTSQSPKPSNRRGFALIAILWLLVAMAALGVDDTATMQDALATAQNRMNITRASWHAEACGEVVRAVTDDALGDTLVAASAAWDTLDLSLASAVTAMPGCIVTARAAGDRLNVNEAGADALTAVFVASGVSEEVADSLTDAVLDWRDADSIPRPRGAEAEWYRNAGRATPPNRPFQDEAELHLVRGFETADSLIALLGVEPGKIVLDRAPLPVIASLPGMTPEAVAHIAEMRWRHEPVGDIARLGASLSQDARGKLTSAYPELVRMVADEPDAWIVRIASTTGAPAVTVVEELRLVRAARRAGVTRARLWP
jgi:type II secretory pathway component PulK